MVRIFSRAFRCVCPALLIVVFGSFDVPTLDAQEQPPPPLPPDRVAVIARVVQATALPANWNGPYADALVTNAWEPVHVEQGTLNAGTFFATQIVLRNHRFRKQAVVKPEALYFLVMRPWSEVVAEKPQMSTWQSYDDTESYKADPWFIESLREVAHDPKKYSAWKPRTAIGRDGWLFLALTQELGPGLSPEAARPAGAGTLMAQETLKKTQEFNDYLTSLGIRFVVAVAPNKSTIYPDRMAETIPEGALFPMALLKREYDAGGYTFPLIDLTPALLEARNRESRDLYFQRDTHWNDLGALTGISVINKTLAEWFPGQKIPGLDDYEIQTVALNQPNDLIDSMGINKRFLQPTTMFKHILRGGSSLKLESDKPGLKLYTKEGNGTATAYVRADSYVVNHEALIAEGFARTHVDITPRNPDALKNLIAEIKPDVVVYLYVERMFLRNPLRETPQEQ